MTWDGFGTGRNSPPPILHFRRGTIVFLCCLLVGLLLLLGLGAWGLRERQFRNCLKEGKELLEGQDFARALLAFQTAYRLRPQHALARAGLVQAYRWQVSELLWEGQVETALALLEEGYVLTGDRELQELLQDVVKRITLVTDRTSLPPGGCMTVRLVMTGPEGELLLSPRWQVTDPQVPVQVMDDGSLELVMGSQPLVVRAELGPVIKEVSIDLLTIGPGDVEAFIAQVVRGYNMYLPLFTNPDDLADDIILTLVGNLILREGIGKVTGEEMQQRARGLFGPDLKQLSHGTVTGTGLSTLFWQEETGHYEIHGSHVFWETLVFIQGVNRTAGYPHYFQAEVIFIYAEADWDGGQFQLFDDLWRLVAKVPSLDGLSLENYPNLPLRTIVVGLARQGSLYFAGSTR